MIPRGVCYSHLAIEPCPACAAIYMRARLPRVSGALCALGYASRSAGWSLDEFRQAEAGLWGERLREERQAIDQENF